jgi:response regulator RpfG family c-di-GMP phosphodiesterase
MELTAYSSILLIDDDELNNILNRQFLVFCMPKAHISTFQDASLVIEYLRSGKINVPDLILLDINMPEMNGWEFLFMLDRYNIDCDVMILSSSVHWDDIEKSKSYSRVKSYLEKPLTEENIRSQVINRNYAHLGLD